MLQRHRQNIFKMWKKFFKFHVSPLGLVVLAFDWWADKKKENWKPSVNNSPYIYKFLLSCSVCSARARGRRARRARPLPKKKKKWHAPMPGMGVLRSALYCPIMPDSRERGFLGGGDDEGHCGRLLAPPSPRSVNLPAGAVYWFYRRAPAQTHTGMQTPRILYFRHHFRSHLFIISRISITTFFVFPLNRHPHFYSLFFSFILLVLHHHHHHLLLLLLFLPLSHSRATSSSSLLRPSQLSLPRSLPSLPLTCILPRASPPLCIENIHASIFSPFIVLSINGLHHTLTFLTTNTNNKNHTSTNINTNTKHPSTPRSTASMTKFSGGPRQSSLLTSVHSPVRRRSLSRASGRKRGSGREGSLGPLSSWSSVTSSSSSSSRRLSLPHVSNHHAENLPPSSPVSSCHLSMLSSCLSPLSTKRFPDRTDSRTSDSPSMLRTLSPHRPGEVAKGTALKERFLRARYEVHCELPLVDFVEEEPNCGRRRPKARRPAPRALSYPRPEEKPRKTFCDHASMVPVLYPTPVGVIWFV